MNTQNETRENEQEYSDIKVSKPTGEVLEAMRKVVEAQYLIEGLKHIEKPTVDKIDEHLYAVRDMLDDELVHHIAMHQGEINHSYETI